MKEIFATAGDLFIAHTMADEEVICHCTGTRMIFEEGLSHAYQAWAGMSEAEKLRWVTAHGTLLEGDLTMLHDYNGDKLRIAAKAQYRQTRIPYVWADAAGHRIEASNHPDNAHEERRTKRRKVAADDRISVGIKIEEDVHRSPDVREQPVGRSEMSKKRKVDGGRKQPVRTDAEPGVDIPASVRIENDVDGPPDQRLAGVEVRNPPSTDWRESAPSASSGSEASESEASESEASEAAEPDRKSDMSESEQEDHEAPAQTVPKVSRRLSFTGTTAPTANAPVPTIQRPLHPLSQADDWESCIFFSQTHMGIGTLGTACRKKFKKYAYKEVRGVGSIYAARFHSRDVAARAARKVNKLGKTRVKFSLYDPSIFTKPMVFITRCDPWKSSVTVSSDAIIKAVAEAANISFCLERDLTQGCMRITFAQQLQETKFRITVTAPDSGWYGIDFDLAWLLPCKQCGAKHIRKVGDTSGICKPTAFEVAPAPADDCRSYLTVPPR